MRRAPAASETVFTPSGLNRRTRSLLETQLGRIWLEGEVSNLARPASGHLYFTLKDQSAQVRCAMFKRRGGSLPPQFANGLSVLVHAKVSLYEGRGEFQLIVDHLEEAGIGRLQRELELLKQKLQVEGLFDTQRKRALPSFPKCIGIVSSPSGAALHDVLNVVSRRYAPLHVLLYPASVQGARAVPELTAAIDAANHHKLCDLLLLTRGGGSLEDLWAFNDEQLARTIAGSEIPVVAAIGHEVDVTIAELVADLRAPTPSAAAEMVTPDALEIEHLFSLNESRLRHLMEGAIRARAQRMDTFERQLQLLHPKTKVTAGKEQLKRLSQRLRLTAERDVKARANGCNALFQRLRQSTPATLIAQLATRRQHVSQRLCSAAQRRVDREEARLKRHCTALDGVSPLATLARGYSITRSSDGDLIKDASQVKVGDALHTTLAEGTVESEVITPAK